jgi:hypothetical protein
MVPCRIDDCCLQRAMAVVASTVRIYDVLELVYDGPSTVRCSGLVCRKTPKVYASVIKPMVLNFAPDTLVPCKKVGRCSDTRLPHRSRKKRGRNRLAGLLLIRL